MPAAHSIESKTARIMALYPDGWHAFVLADGATFRDLAQSLEDLAGAHNGAALEVEVRFDNDTSHQPGQMPRRTQANCDADLGREPNWH